MNPYELARRNKALAAERHGKIGPRRMLPVPKSSEAPLQHEIRRILVLLPGSSSFALFATPALNALRDALPSAYISVLTGPQSQEVLRHNPHIDMLRVEPELASHPEDASLRRLAQWADKLRQETYDAALVMAPGTWHAAALTARARIPRRLGVERYHAGRYLTDSTPHEPLLHAVALNLRLVKMLLGTTPVISPRLQFRPDEAQVALAQRTVLGSLTTTRPLIAILAGDGTQPAHWRPAAWAFVADQLTLQHSAQIVLVDENGTSGATQAIAQAMRFRPHIIDQPLSVPALAALFARCELVLGSHSDAIHLAIALERPAVILYGPHDPAYVGAWGDEARFRIIRATMACAHCGLPQWRGDMLEKHPCVRELKSYTVLNAALELLEAPIAAGTRP